MSECYISGNIYRNVLCTSMFKKMCYLEMKKNSDVINFLWDDLQYIDGLMVFLLKNKKK